MHLYVQWYRTVIQCYVIMSACSVVRLCAVVNKLHFYFYIRCNNHFVVMHIVFRFQVFPKYMPYQVLEYLILKALYINVY